MLPGGRQRGRHLPHAWIGIAHVGVDFGQELRLLGEGGRADRVLVAVEMAVGARRRLGQCAGIAALHRRHCVGGAQQRRFRKFARVRVSRCLARHRAQAEPLVGAVVRRLQPAIVEHQRFALARFEIELAVIGAGDRFRHDLLEAGFGNVE
jgi:hypothetical protein